jgi:hypothetical protein
MAWNEDNAQLLQVFMSLQFERGEETILQRGYSFYHRS